MAGSPTGRRVSNTPRFQQLPLHTREAAQIRTAFLKARTTMSQDMHPPRDPSKPAEAQGLFNKYNVTRTDGRVKEGAQYFVLDAANDPHAIPALAAYAEACQATHPGLSRDITARWLAKPEHTAPGAPSVARAVSSDAQWRKLRIPAERLRALGVSEQAAAMLTAGTEGGILWHDLARRDGMLALAALPQDKLGELAVELQVQGAPIPLASAAAIAHFLYVAAEQYCPTGEWASRALTSAVATALLLRLAESAWRGPQIVLAGSNEMPQ